MPLKLERKKELVAELADVASRSNTMLVAEYSGITVGQMTKLRSTARNAKVHIGVIRNTLARRALTGTQFECINDALVGHVLLAFAGEELSAPARLMRDFGKTNDKLIVKALSLGGKLYGGEQLNMVAKLPTLDEALASLLAVMQAPIAKFMRTASEPHAKLVRTIAAVRDQKQAQA